MLKDAVRSKFDVALEWAMHRLDRSLAEQLDRLRTFESARRSDPH
jgi:hypothetical protein